MLSTSVVHGVTADLTEPLHDRVQSTHADTGLPVRIMGLRASAVSVISPCRCAGARTRSRCQIKARYRAVPTKLIILSDLRTTRPSPEGLGNGPASARRGAILWTSCRQAVEPKICLEVQKGVSGWSIECWRGRL